MSFLLVLCMVFSMLPVVSSAAVTASGKCGENLTWKLDDTGKLTISGTGEMENYGFQWDENGEGFRVDPGWKDLKITSLVVEKGVTSISEDAFAYTYTLTSVSLPDTLVSIGAWAFNGCYSLEGTFRIPASVKFIGERALANLMSVAAFEVAAGNTSFASKNGVLYNADMTKLEMYPAASSATSFTVPDSVKTIGTLSFSCGGKLENLTIGSKVKTIENYAFSGNTSLKSISVSSANSVFASKNGTLLSKDGKLLIVCPAGHPGSNGVFSVPDGVETIESEAFRNCGFTKIILPDSVKTLSSLAFTYLDNLASIDLGKVETIGDCAFQGCSSLKSLKIPATVSMIEGFLASDTQVLQSVIFEGDAPEVSPYIESVLTADDIPITAYYLPENTTWTDAVKAVFGSNVTWLPYTGRVVNLLTIEDGTFEYYSNVTEKTESYTFDYDENWFFESGSRYHHSLAQTSMAVSLAASSESSASIKKMLDTMGFSNVEDHYVTPGEDTIGYVIGSKIVNNDFGEQLTLVSVAIRGGGYGSEWASNMTIGTSTEHQGFSKASGEVVAAVKAYLKKTEKTDGTILWITGFSRAAAVANLSAHTLATEAKAGKISGLNEHAVIAYCFACPRGVRTDHAGYADNCGNIYNIVNPADLVPLVAPAAWDFERYGVTYYLPSAELNYRKFNAGYSAMKKEYQKILAGANSDAQVSKLTGYAQNHRKKLTNSINAIAAYFENQNAYVQNHQSNIRRAFASNQENGAGGLVGVMLGVLPGFVKSNPAAAAELLGVASNVGNNHYHELYLSWMNSLSGKTEFVEYNRTRYLKVNCPVDIAVYDSTGVLVAQIVNDQVQTVEGSSICAELDENGQKVVCLPLDEEFRVEISATGDGTMSCQVEEVDVETGDTSRIINYYDIEIRKGDTLTGTAGSVEDANTQVSTYSLTAPDGKSVPADIEITQDIPKYKLAVSGEGFGSVSGGGLYVTGEYAKVSAVPDAGMEFLGWYADDVLVSQDPEFRIRVEADTALVGKFTHVIRVFGADRYATAFKAADTLKAELGVEKFQNVIVASGTGFADALAGSYLAAQKNAPILLVRGANVNDVKNYIKSNPAM